MPKQTTTINEPAKKLSTNKLNTKRKWDRLSLGIWADRFKENNQWAASKLAEFQLAKSQGQANRQHDYNIDSVLEAADKLNEIGEQHLAENLLKSVAIISPEYETAKKRKSRYDKSWDAIYLFSDRVWNRFNIPVSAMSELIYKTCEELDIITYGFIPNRKDIERKLKEKYKQKERPMFTTKDRVKVSELDCFTIEALASLKK